MEYRPAELDAKWQRFWREKQTFSADFPSEKPKFYVLDMFPYPSGAGLHVGHPLGYIASDIVARYKRHQGFNVLHPMGYDAFGLPAEQYAIQTGQHPELTTEKNIDRYREQLDRIGFSFDWGREVRTCRSDYYRWTQWIFIQLFHSWFNEDRQKAEPISTLVDRIAAHGTQGLKASHHGNPSCSSNDWAEFGPADREALLQHYRLAFRSESVVNWCPAMGTVLANDEVLDGRSERGGHPVVQKPMLQWSLRISAYAERLLSGLDGIDWSDSMKETQRNWIGRSQGARVRFNLPTLPGEFLEIFTTRPDTLYGVTFMVLAPEHPLLDALSTTEQKAQVAAYQEQAARRSERERQADTKSISGAFTGSYARHPFSGAQIPIWTSDYVLMGYGTGAIMAVPAHDSRDYAFARHFDLPMVEVVGGGELSKGSHDAKEGQLINSDFLNGLEVQDAIDRAIQEVESRCLGERRIQYRLRDAVFGRQRYWGEPIPVQYRDGVPETLPESELPLILPPVDAYLPTEDGEPPLARAAHWESREGLPLETTTMPGWAASSWYFLRYMDSKNDQAFAHMDSMDYWGQVDLYVGGSEHGTGHLLYSRFWGNFLFDRGFIPFAEPFKKLVNQGMIQGISAFVHRVEGSQTYISADVVASQPCQAVHVDVSLVNEKDELDLKAFRQWMPEFSQAQFDPAQGPIRVRREVEKMSKSKHNVINPDAICSQHGADALRLYEMFLGPLEQSKPWDTNGLSGVTGFLRKVSRLMDKRHAGDASKEESKTLHKLIDKIQRDMESLSFNTSVSAMMIAVNEWGNKAQLADKTLADFAVLLSPFAPHLGEELWSQLGHSQSIAYAPFPALNPALLIEDSQQYPVQFNGKTRFMVEVPNGTAVADVEALVRGHQKTASYVEDKQIRKVIVILGRIVNVVVG
ncbi:MAG: leucine--tRNA ligase [Schleiferiaceae bacterium]|nr:leucine--tRNA ligase [Schleiferiaceae bacterium]